jgi:hypothetical protein
VPGFSVGLQLRLPDNTKVYLALDPAEFTLTFRDDKTALSVVAPFTGARKTQA